MGGAKKLSSLSELYTGWSEFYVVEYFFIHVDFI
jgi:hypothetical protein